MTIDNMESWSIAVKTVRGPGCSISEVFTVTVSPEDDLTSLHDQIEEYTGLAASQQRLIYRGRIIKRGESNESIKNEPKVKDVVGLADGQTIHLVPRLDSDPQQETTSQVRSDNSTVVASRSTNDSPEPATGGLLAALLGLGSSDETADEPLGQHLARLRSARIRNRNRRPNHRLTASDLEVIDPGTMEPVRQGLMTLHTMLGDRMWYRGQWIDCRDTVNQWLEATVVDVITPHDVLPTHYLQTCSVSPRRCRYPTTDPAVPANDLEGRMRLLLEPLDEGDGYRPRENNDGVHLLLIHYNGWPNRWDEWIRSDSERIRPFRTRTRHPNSSTTACPTPQSHFQGSPPTNISSEDESADRAFLLPELQRVFHMVQELLDQTVEVENVPNCESNESNQRLVPWITGGIQDNDPPPSENSLEGADADSLIPEEAKISSSSSANIREKTALKKQLQALGPLLDRLGRTMTDAAPHLAAYAESLTEETDRPIQRGAPGDSNVVFDDEDALEDASVHETGIDHSTTMAGLFSLLPVSSRSAQIPAAAEPVTVELPDYVDFLNGSVNTTRGEVRSRAVRSSDNGSSLLGAYLAAASLSSLANDDDGNDGGASGLQGLGRLLSQREANGGLGGGIDIHIHAIVTGPTVGGGTIGALGGIGGLAMLGEPVLPRPTLFSSTSRRIGFAEAQRLPIAVPVNDEDAGIFSELYSENPPPVDLQNGVLPVESRSTDIGQLFEDMADLESIASIPPRGLETPPRQPRGGPLSRMIRRLSSRRRSSNTDR